MKPIKITDANSDAIATALRDVNGKAAAHTFLYPSEIMDVAADAEKRLEGLNIPKGERAGAIFYAISGDSLPSAYKYSARATRVVIARRGAGWYLNEVTAAEIYGGNSGNRRMLSLTAAQDAKAIEVLRRGYNIQPAAQPLAQVA